MYGLTSLKASRMTSMIRRSKKLKKIVLKGIKVHGKKPKKTAKNGGKFEKIES